MCHSADQRTRKIALDGRSETTDTKVVTSIASVANPEIITIDQHELNTRNKNRSGKQAKKSPRPLVTATKQGFNLPESLMKKQQPYAGASISPQ